jgi:prepilin-type N-terminal cleavage/methylation domain-containing protein
MIKNIQKRIKAKKGFTLIEIIVVLVILAILVAIALPTMFGYVEDARNRAFAQDARVGFLAAQWVVSEAAMVVSSADRNEAAFDAAGTIPGNPSFDSKVDGVSGTFRSVVIEGQSIDGDGNIVGDDLSDVTGPQVIGIVYEPDDADVMIIIFQGQTTFI